MPPQLTSDYEPVTPLRRAPAHAGGADWADAPAPHADPDAGGDARVSNARPAPPRGAAAAKAAPKARKPWLERWGTRRGHLLAYAGLFLFTVILYYRPYEQISFLSSFTSMAFWAGVATLLAFFPTQLSLEGTLTARPREVNLLLLLVLTALLSVPLALDPGEALATFNDPFLKAVLMFLVIVNAVRTMRRLRWLLLLGVSVGCLLSAWAIDDYRRGLFTVEGYRVTGSIGNLFGNPNDMAIHLITMIPIVVAFMFGARGVRKLFYACCLFLLMGGMMVTFSRGGFLGLAGASVVMAWKLGRRNRFAVLALMLAAVVLMMLFAPGGYSRRLLSIIDPSLDPVGSSSARQQLLLLSVKASLLNPLFGLGMGNFHIISIREAVTHNSYTQVAAEMGWAALAFYVLFIVTPLRRLKRIELATLESRRASNFYYLAVGLQASLVAYMIGSFFGSIAYQWYVYYLVGFAVALRRLYATTGEVKGVGAEALKRELGAEAAPEGGDEPPGGKPAADGWVLYDARSARVVAE